jgi:DNA mismatch repair protein MutS
VIDRAREILTNLERNEFGPEGTPRLARRRRREDGQLPLFVPAGEAILPPPADHPALRALRETDPDRLSPLEALNRLAELKRLSEE